ncbi:MAG: diaminopimelate decarboxylase [Sulfolobales archaeon]|nr:diaminopimelate decarboxylase [Sulfolobales archaeon]MDW8082795.1 diaminopimelate decarboxylase [Sulfolobales archaeon]
MIEVIGSHLYIGSIKAEQIANVYGTPIYVYDVEVVVDNYFKLKNSIKYRDLEVMYACKANCNVEILKALRDLGAGLDAVSPWEAALAVRIGFKREKILFTGSNVESEEMKFVRGELGILVNVDSISQLRRYGRMFPDTEVSIRINPGIGAGHHEYAVTGGITKFGIYLNQLKQVEDILKEHRLKLVGLHTHIGSGILRPEPFIDAAEKLLQIAVNFTNLEFIDIGGGFGIPYRPSEKPLDLDYLGDKLSSLFEDFTSRYGNLKLRVEPGRFIVGNAGVLLVRVVDIKEVESKEFRKVFVGVDSGMNHLIRPALYGAHHEVIAVSKADQPRVVTADVVGNICESGDILALDVQLPKLSEGDVLAVMNAGAYGYSMSSNYNMRPRPPEVAVYRDSIKLTRRRETFEDLLRTYIEL